MTIPLGVVGPILLDGEFYHIPMATTEGCLVASTNRGCNVLTAAGGVKSTLEDEGMTRAPILKFRDIQQAAEVKRWLETPDHFSEIKSKFDSTSRFARLKDIFVKHTGKYNNRQLFSISNIFQLISFSQKKRTVNQTFLSKNISVAAFQNILAVKNQIKISRNFFHGKNSALARNFK